jgi:hypothetical protein
MQIAEHTVTDWRAALRWRPMGCRPCIHRTRIRDE